MTAPHRLDPHEQWAELAAGYALRSLEPDDEQSFEAHLAGCARCEADLREHCDTLAHLAYAPAAPPPPPTLLEGIRAGMVTSGRGVSFGYGQAAPEDVAPSSVTSLSDARRRRAGRTRALTAVAVAAAVAAVLGLGGWNLALRQDAERQQQQFAAAVRQLSVPSTTPVPLRRPGGDTVAVALVKGSEVSLLADDLPRNADGTVYVLWGRVGVELRPVGAFDVTGALDTTTGLRVPGSADGLTQLLLTLEDGDRAPAQPGTRPFASGLV